VLNHTPPDCRREDEGEKVSMVEKRRFTVTRQLGKAVGLVFRTRGAQRTRWDYCKRFLIKNIIRGNSSCPTIQRFSTIAIN